MTGIDLMKELVDFTRFMTSELDAAILPSLEPYQLTLIQSRILLAIHKNENSTVGSLCNIIGSSGNASTACKKLEKQGYIKRTRDSGDERVVKLNLTELGVKTIEAINEEFQEKYAGFFSSIADDDFNGVIIGIKNMKGFMIELRHNQNR